MAARKCTSRVKSKGQPYAGIGGGYLAVLGNISDRILTNFSVDQNFAFVVQGGADLMLTPNWGVYVDGKKTFLSTDSQRFVATAWGRLSAFAPM
jgi:outer membrane protein